jgi:steroid delta-isomerase-like uncharacterized protein
VRLQPLGDLWCKCESFNIRSRFSFRTAGAVAFSGTGFSLCEREARTPFAAHFPRAFDLLLRNETRPQIGFAVTYTSGTIPFTAAQEENMSEANVALMKRWFEEVWNQRRTATITELFAPNGISHGVDESGADIIGPAAFIPFYERFIGAFPDMKLKIEDAIGDGDKVLIRWSATMNHAGDHLGMPATNKPVILTGMCLAKIANGKIVEAWDNWDKLAMLQQIGAVPPLAANAATAKSANG